MEGCGHLSYHPNCLLCRVRQRLQYKQILQSFAGHYRVQAGTLWRAEQRGAWDAPVPVVEADETSRLLLQRLPCLYRGKALQQHAPCQPCAAQGRMQQLYACSRKGVCSPLPVLDRNVAVCASCAERQEPPTAFAGQGAVVQTVARFDQTVLEPIGQNHRFNASLLFWQGDYLLAYRDGWAGSEIWLTWLEKTSGGFQPLGKPWKLNLFHPREAAYGREDPRLFVHQGRVHVAYVGVIGPVEVLHTSVLYARLRADLSDAEEIFYPYYPKRNAWEKNWSFFSHDDQLYAVYSIAPHRVLRIEGNYAYDAHLSPCPAQWLLQTEMRGGSAPVRVDDEYWCFFHSRVEEPRRRYVMGLYTFEAKPPFRPKRFVSQPLLWADPATNPDNYADVVFPCGAVLEKKKTWYVSMGIHDRWTEIVQIPHDALQEVLQPLFPGDDWHYRPDDAGDADTWQEVYLRDVYGIRRQRFEPHDLVLDIGAHIGCFARLAWEQGSRRIHCYEPHPDNVALARQNLPADVTIWPYAMGQGPLYYHHRSAAKAFNVGECRPEPSDLPVSCKTLQEILDEHEGPVALLKLDCEGAEWQALRHTSLAKVRWLVGEAHPRLLGGGTKEELSRLLQQQGFVVTIRDTVPPSEDCFLFSAQRQ